MSEENQTHNFVVELRLSNDAANAMLRLLEASGGADVNQVISEALLLNDAILAASENEQRKQAVQARVVNG